MLGWEDLAGKMTLEKRSGGAEDRSNLPWRENSKCKGSEAGIEWRPLGIK